MSSSSSSVTRKVTQQPNAQQPAPFVPPQKKEVALEGWINPNFEDYKNDILLKYQSLLLSKGIKDSNTRRLLTAQAINENGALDPSVHGDRGCSVGIPQYNTCANENMSGKAFVKKNPQWKELDFQLNWMADRMIHNIEKRGAVWLAIVSHNCPACANGGRDNGYYRKAQKTSLLLTLKSL